MSDNYDSYRGNSSDDEGGYVKQAKNNKNNGFSKPYEPQRNFNQTSI